MKLHKMLASGLLALTLGSVAAVPLTGCAALGLQAPQNLSEGIAAGYKGIAAAADSIGVLLDAGKLDVAAARAAHTRLSEVKKGVDLAVELRDAGDFSSAETRLAAAISALKLLQTELDAKKGAPPS